MTEAEVLELMREYYEGLFPKVCANCNRYFATLREYILATRRLGPTVSYDAEIGDWNTLQPIGTVAYANCPCGSTLALSTENMPHSQRLLLLKWVKIQTQERGMRPEELLDYLRDELRNQILSAR